MYWFFKTLVKIDIIYLQHNAECVGSFLLLLRKKKQKDMC